MTTLNTYVVTGTIADEHTVALDEPLPISQGKVRLVVEPITVPQRSYMEVMETIRERQRLRGHRPPTKEEVDAYIQGERNSWGDDHAPLS
ncbi:MAG: hypothetical protein KJ000_19330 [Pirellulaceae bacterium]|nr:hypothetical protein [Pirellulaceae bacterium]